MKEHQLSHNFNFQVDETGRPLVMQLHGSFEAFGVVFDYLSRTDPFTRFPVGHFCSIVRQQLRMGHHLVAMEGPIVVGYVGWILTSKEIGEQWQRADGKLMATAENKADAAALTVVASKDRSILIRLIRGARTLNPGRRVYFKREYDDDTKSQRKSSVANVVRSSATIKVV
ncbi:MAG: hypothetical protein ABI705_07635 [Aestuariivirga sp.]